jgi:hypothetical protein
LLLAATLLLLAATLLLLAAVLGGCVPIPPVAEPAGATPVETVVLSPLPTGAAGEIAAVPSGGATPGAQPTALDWPALLRNLEYKSAFTRSGTALLVGGRYREPAAPGSAASTEVTLTDALAVGDLTGNGMPGAVVVLATETGGSGVFMDLAAVALRAGSPANVATASLGDRVKINSLSLQDGTISVDMITQGPADPMCCPTQRVVEEYRLQGDELVKLSSKIVGK